MFYNYYVNLSELYKLLNASSNEDILRVFPSRYESLIETPLDAVPIEYKRYVIKGTIYNVKTINNHAKSIIRFNLLYRDQRKLNMMIFNQPFYYNKLVSGDDLLFVCYYSDSRKAYSVSLIVSADSFYALSGIRPVYSLPKGVSQSYFSNYIRKLLSSDYASPSLIVPKKLRDKYHLLDTYTAFRCVHLPRNETDLKNGLRVFKYEEALQYAITSLQLKEKADEKKKENPIPIDHDKINQFVKKLSFKLTKDQLKAIRDIVLDMEKEKVMYRLLQGDVGTGKTLVAFASLYANYLRRQQGIFMAPTYELALQHYQNALKIFESYSLNIAFLSGNQTAKEKKAILTGLENGTIDILIATHAAISDKVSFASLGLSVIDEQQRFGVKQREKLLEKGKVNDILMMSATPIPRTLSQIINADLDVSTLEEYPNGERKVKTVRLRSTDPLLYVAIEKSLKAKRQIFIIAPKIEEGTRNVSSGVIEIYKEISERFGEENCQLLHGKIKKTEQEKIYQSFLNGEKLILVSTTIVEVGIDVSKAGLLVVYDANYFGLSSLHQLRGRIGRSGDFALAVLVYDGEEREAIEKLDFLASTNDGLKISEYDLKMRGTGSYSGEKQSGKSELMVCNFVEDYKVFLAAKEDAKEILRNPQDKENAAYLKQMTGKKETFLI